MIELLLKFGGDVVLIRVENNNVTFSDSKFGNTMATIDGLQLSKSGVVKKFPDLEDNENWREEAIKRFKEKIKSYQTEQQKADYLIEDLSKFGYEPAFIKQKGHRRKKLGK